MKEQKKSGSKIVKQFNYILGEWEWYVAYRESQFGQYIYTYMDRNRIKLVCKLKCIT